jgi:transposase
VEDEVLTGELRARLEPLIPVRPRQFKHPWRRRTPDRGAFEGILWVARTGIGWNQLPTSLFGVSGATCRRRLAEWQEAGVWQKPPGGGTRSSLRTRRDASRWRTYVSVAVRGAHAPAALSADPLGSHHQVAIRMTIGQPTRGAGSERS